MPSQANDRRINFIDCLYDLDRRRKVDLYYRDDFICTGVMFKVFSDDYDVTIQWKNKLGSSGPYNRKYVRVVYHGQQNPDLDY